jgi:hypothetical protein
MQSVSKRHAIPVIYPVADAFNGTVTSDVVEVQGEGVLFEINKGVGATGTSWSNTVLTGRVCSSTVDVTALLTTSAVTRAKAPMTIHASTRPPAMRRTHFI